mgnify:CR=1 FL=1|tara:strand:- start:2764 stop:3453 length:690 start_codon:yes stop_codon:yes gene_type:complete
MVSFIDIAKGSDHLVKFLHVATNTRVEFPAFINDYSDTYAVNWGTENIFGRMDPIKPYQGTTRSITLGFDIVAPSLSQAKKNMFNYSKLVQMLYPVYSTPLNGGMEGRGRVILAPPLMRVQFLNLIKNNSSTNQEQGLLGCISGFSFSPNTEAGYYTQENELLPKVFSLSFVFDPQHEESLGFQGNTFITPNFPYGRSETADPSSNSIGSTNADVTQANLNSTLNSGDS